MIEAIARLCHNSNMLYCISIGDFSQVEWEEAPEWQRESAIKGVIHVLDNKDPKPEDSHNSWLKEKANSGWKYGKVKDPDKKEHPCFVDYALLPQEQKNKDILFIATVHESIDKNSEYVIKKDIIFNKVIRKSLDGGLQIIKSLTPSRERSLAITKIQEGIMWMGMDLKRLNEPNPYPNSYNSNNTKIEPTADNLKL